jgi:hypothetical protein
MLFNRSVLTTAACGAIALGSSHQAQADVTAEAELVLTITINDIFLLNPDDTGTSALNFDIELSDVGVNTNFFGGGAGSNDPGAIGSNSESETVFFNGIDVDGDFNASDTELSEGDTIVITQSVMASASTPDTIFFSQVDSEFSLFFDSFGGPDQRFLFDFDVQATLTGEFDLTMPGSALVNADGEEIYALAEATEGPVPTEFILFEGENQNYYDLFDSTTAETVTPISETSTTLNIPIEFSPGDNQQTITFRSSLVVNAVTEVPEPSSLALLGLGGLMIARRRRRLA